MKNNDLEARATVKTPNLLDLCERIEGQNILVVGDIMLDRYVRGAVDRISPESPVPVLSIKNEDQMLGGAGNALANLAGLKAKGIILSVIGDDEHATLVRNEVEALGFASDGLITDTARQTSVKTRYLAGHQQLLRSDSETKTPISKETATILLQKASQALPNVKAVLLSDYGKGVLSLPVIKALIEEAKTHNIPIIVDPKGQDFSIYKGATMITPNRKEISDATNGQPTDTDQEIESAAQHLIEQCGVESILATRSGDGMSLITKDENPLHLKGADIEVFDVSGAGDAVIATMTASLAAGALASDGMHLANLAGAIVVTKVGTAPIRVEELKENLLETQNMRSSLSRTRQAPLVDESAALEEVQRWRARGYTIGLTNGCFDVLHTGHVSYLNEARSHCDRLIVALNHDASVKLLKGPERPIHAEFERATVLGALASVDLVILFGAQETGDDNTASALIKHLKPNIYFKGGDYTQDEIPESPAVKAAGGSVKILSEFQGHSTTGSIQKIRKGQAA